MAASTAAKALLGGMLGARVPYVTFLSAVVIAALYGGLPGGLLATFLSGIAASFWIEPIGHIGIRNPADWVGMVVFLATGVLVSVACEGMLRTQASLLATERRARQEHERYARLFTIVHEGFAHYRALYDERGNVTDLLVLEVNPAGARLCGKAPGEQIGRTWSDLYAGQDLSLLAHIQRADETGETVRFDEGRLLPGRTLDVTISPIAPAEFAVTFSDITERKQSEEALRISEDKFTKAFACNPAAISLTQLGDGTFLDVNETWVELMGYSREEVVGRSAQAVGVWADPEDRVRYVAELRRTGSMRNREFRFRRKSGQAFVALVSVEVLTIGGEELTLLTFLDVTERKELERELHERADALARADQAKDEFLAMLAHELRNPLGAIGNATMLLGMHASGEQSLRKPLEILNRQVRHTARLVDDLLDVSRISSGKLTLRLETMDLVAIARRAAETAQPQMALSGHKLQLSLPVHSVWVDGDAARLEQVLGNLLNNAAKYTDAGGTVVLTVRSEGRGAVIEVRDTGRGIAPEMLTRIFDLFAQEDRSLARSNGGLGIGLTLAKTLVEMHGGTVYAESAGKDRGSTFTVRLPLAQHESTEPGSGDIASDQDSVVPALRVLVVDDNVDTAQALSEILELWGHDVGVAYDGPTAVEAASLQMPDVVLLDIGLPVMDGYEVARALRQREETATTLIVALTGYGQAADQYRGRVAGISQHLVKPVDMELLRAVIAAAGRAGER